MSQNVRNKFTPREPTKLTDPGISKTQQHFKEETLMSNIVDKYRKGLPVATNKQQAKFGDMSSMDFQDMQNIIADISMQFASLPAKLRGKFQNRPENLMRWLENPANQQTAIKLGLISPPEAEYDPDAVLASHAQLDLAREAERIQNEAKKAEEKPPAKA